MARKKNSPGKKSANLNRNLSQNSPSRKNMAENRSNHNIVERSTTSRERPHQPSEVNGWLICSVVVLCFLVAWLLIKNLDWGSNEIYIWVLFTLISTALSCGISAFISYRSQKIEEVKENNIMKKIEELFDENKGETTSKIKIALERSDLACGNQETVLRMLMDWSLEIDGITRIRILAHTSDSFSNILKKYFNEKDTENKFENTALKVLIHDQNTNETSKVVKDWLSICKEKGISLFEIRRTKNTVRRSFFGMVIEFNNHHSIGMIGFYEPQDQVKAYKHYGVFSEDGSILDILNKYIEYYFDDVHSIQLAMDSKNGSV